MYGPVLDALRRDAQDALNDVQVNADQPNLQLHRYALVHLLAVVHYEQNVHCFRRTGQAKLLHIPALVPLYSGITPEGHREVILLHNLHDNP